MKQVMIVRRDLKMGKGKIAAQCCHGAIGAYKKSPADKIRKWENEAYAKVVLKVETLEELTELKKLADEKGLSSVAFCCISTGVFMFPNERAAEIAVETVRDYLDSTGSRIKVIFNVFKDIDYLFYKNLLE